MTDEPKYKPGQVVTHTFWPAEKAEEARDYILQNKPDLWERMKLVEIDTGDFNDHQELLREFHQFLMRKYELKPYDMYLGAFRDLWNAEIIEEIRACLDAEAPGLWERLREDTAERMNQRLYRPIEDSALMLLLEKKHPALGNGSYEGIRGLLTVRWRDEICREVKSFIESQAPGLWQKLRAAEAKKKKKEPTTLLDSSELIMLLKELFPGSGNITFDYIRSLLRDRWHHEIRSKDKGE